MIRIRHALTAALATTLATAGAARADIRLDTGPDKFYEEGHGGIGGSADGDGNSTLTVLSVVSGALHKLSAEMIGVTFNTNTPGDQFGRAVASGDFDCDGVADLVIGVPGEDGTDSGVNSTAKRDGKGAVLIAYAPAGATRFEVWNQATDAVYGSPEKEDGFGSALAAGDFDNDGCDDLAIGVPGEDHSAGMVQVFYGAPGGLSASRQQAFNEAGSMSPAYDLPGQPDAYDEVGKALAAGDFNGDGFVDLAIGAPGQASHGEVYVLTGTRYGLTVFPAAQVWSSDTPGVVGAAHDGDEFGAALAVGDFDADGRDDLAIGAPSYHSTADGGAVTVLRGSPFGLYANLSQLWTESSPGIAGYPEDGDEFGKALAVGDFDGDGIDDLAIGVPNEDHPTDTGYAWAKRANGAVYALHGERGYLGHVGGLTSTSTDPATKIWPDSLGWGHYCWGTALAAGDFDGNGRADLAIGGTCGGNEIDTPLDAGKVKIVPGYYLTGLLPLDATTWSQLTAGVQGWDEDGDAFGGALAAPDLDGDGFSDLVVGSYGEDDNAGAVHVLFGQPWPANRGALPGLHLGRHLAVEPVRAGLVFGREPAARREPRAQPAARLGQRVDVLGVDLG
jgi:hypothetical protein